MRDFYLGDVCAIGKSPTRWVVVEVTPTVRFARYESESAQRILNQIPDAGAAHCEICASQEVRIERIRCRKHA